MNRIIIEGKFEGYVWYSDQDTPQIYCGQELELSDEDNPFIIEGQLCDGNTSYSIKYIDGKYFVKKYNLTCLPKEDVVDKFYQSYRMNGKVLSFKECWRLESDALCCGMDVLQPKEIIFVGFKK